MSAARRFVSILLCAAVMLCLCGCSRASGAQLVTINVMTVLGDDELFAVYSQALAGFTLENDLVTVKDTTVKASDAYKLKLSEADTYVGVDSPDVICASADMLDEDSMSEIFVPVNTLREDYPQYVHEVLSTAIDSARSGIEYCVPLYGEYECMLANMRLLAKYGVELPFDDFSQLSDVIARLESDGIPAFANPPEDRSALIEQLVLLLGGEQALELGVQRDEQTLRDIWQMAFELYRSIGRTPVSASDVYRTDAEELFASDRAAFLLADGKIAAAFGGGQEYEVFTLPSANGSEGAGSYVSADFSVGFYITRKAYSDPDRLEAAIKYVEYMTGTGVGEDIARLGLLSSNAGALGSEEQSLLAQVHQLAVQADGFVGALTQENRTFAADLSSRMSELSGGMVDGAYAAELLLLPGSRPDFDLLLQYQSAETDIINVQTP